MRTPDKQTGLSKLTPSPLCALASPTMAANNEGATLTRTDDQNPEDSNGDAKVGQAEAEPGTVRDARPQAVLEQRLKRVAANPDMQSDWLAGPGRPLFTSMQLVRLKQWVVVEERPYAWIAEQTGATPEQLHRIASDNGWSAEKRRRAANLTMEAEKSIVSANEKFKVELESIAKDTLELAVESAASAKASVDLRERNLHVRILNGALSAFNDTSGRTVELARSLGTTVNQQFNYNLSGYQLQPIPVLATQVDTTTGGAKNLPSST